MQKAIWGVLEPGYARSYLYVAYRSLSGNNLSPGEQKSALALWKGHDVFPNYDRSTDKKAPDTPVHAWLLARQQVPGIRPAVLEDSDPSGITGIVGEASPYERYYNCLADAFNTARATLQSKIKQFGVTSPLIREWIDAQDKVFANCDPGSEVPGPVLPALAKQDDLPLVRADRAYQIAAAYFYAGELDAATERFDQIARDTNSPWRKIASLVAARALIRQATFNGNDQEFLQRAEARLKSFLADVSSRDLHPAAERLLGFVEFRLHPKERTHELALKLINGPDSNLEQDLWDYKALLNQLAGYASPSPPVTIAGSSKNELEILARLHREDDLTD